MILIIPKWLLILEVAVYDSHISKRIEAVPAARKFAVWVGWRSASELMKLK